MNDESKWLNDDVWLSEINWLDEVRKDFELPERLWVHDCTVREAEQMPNVVFRPEEKIAIVKELDRLGVDSYEIFPLISEDDKEVTRQLVKMNLRPILRCLCRYMISDVELAIDLGCKYITVENTANTWNNKIAYGIDENVLTRRFVEAIRLAKDNGLHVTCMPWDTYRSPLPFLEKLYKSIVYEGGADRVVVVDSSGIGLPHATTWFVKKVRSWVPGIPVEFHSHNEGGLALSSMVSAIIGGASGVHSVLNGFGTRGGNVATEEIVFAAEKLLGVKTGVNMKRLYPACKLVQDIGNMPVAPNKSIIGKNLFAYSTGLSIDLWRKARAAGRSHAFVPFKPDLIGYPGYDIVLGKTTGKAAVKAKLSQLGVNVPEESLADLTADIKSEAILRKRDLDTSVIIALAEKYIQTEK